MIDSWQPTNRTCKWMACANYAQHNTNTLHRNQPHCAREESGALHLPQTVVHSDLAEPLPPKANSLIALTIVMQNARSFSTETRCIYDGTAISRRLFLLSSSGIGLVCYAASHDS